MFCTEAVIHWWCLFNMFLHFGCSPSKLLEVKLCPISKDKNGDLNDLNNCRHIVFSCLLKLPELLLLDCQFDLNDLDNCRHIVFSCLLKLPELLLLDCQFDFRRNQSINIVYALLQKIASEFSCKGNYVPMLFRNEWGIWLRELLEAI